MKVLHTSDWHVGKVLKGQSRMEEHAAVLGELVEIARGERPDLVLVAGDLFDSAAPTPAATRLVTGALSALRATGADVVAIAGNHDNGPALDALRPWAEAAGVTLRGTIRSPAENTVTGDGWRLVALPFLSQRYAVRATEMFALSAAEASQTYADHVARLVSALCEPFATDDRVNLVTTHLTVVGATAGGGEREAHTIQSYAVPAAIFPATAHYVALGHLHRAQTVPGPAPTRYCGSPLAVDFGDAAEPKRRRGGEAAARPGVTMVEIPTGGTARIRHVPITSAAPLRTLRGTLDELAAAEPEPEAWLRVYVREQPRAGLRERVQELLPRALEVRVDPDLLPAAGAASRATRAGRSPTELFADYLADRGHADDRVRQLFAELYEEEVSAS